MTTEQNEGITFNFRPPNIYPLNQVYKTHTGEIIDTSKHQYACLTKGQLEAFIVEFELHEKGLPCTASVGTENDWREAQWEHFTQFYGWDK